MVQRPFWLGRLEEAWKEAPIVWLSGVRRSGKTTLARSLGEERVFYVNCDLPVIEERARPRLAHPVQDPGSTSCRSCHVDGSRCR